MRRLEDLCRELVRRRGSGAKFMLNGTAIPPSIAAEDCMPLLLRQAARTVSIVSPGHERTIEFLPGMRGQPEGFRFSSRADAAVWLPALLDALECAAETPEERAVRDMQARAVAASQSAGEGLQGAMPDEPAPSPSFVLDRINPPVPALKAGSARAGGLADPAFAALDCFPGAEAFQQSPDAAPGGGRQS